MASSATQNKLIALGNLLVDQLSDESGADMLSRWMAHYVAEQITEAESSRGNKRAVAQQRCFRIILELWAHNHSLPSGRRPFERFEPILAALAALDPNAPGGFYHPFALSKRRRETTPASVADVVELVCSLDSAARVLIEALLTDATERATDKRTRAYLANAIPGRKAQQTRAVRKLLEQRDRLDLKRSGTSAEKKIRDRIEKLQRFEKICAQFQSALSRELENTTPSKGA